LRGRARSGWSRILLLLALAQATALAAQQRAPADPPVDVLTPWTRMKVLPGDQVATRMKPPRKGRNTCIDVEAIAGAQLFGDAAIELTMRDGRHWRMFFAQECPALSFYQGFYYRRSKANMLCAGRDVVGARSGGECPIASIMPVRIPGQPPPGP
jgi:hypothetical protein